MTDNFRDKADKLRRLFVTHGGIDSILLVFAKEDNLCIPGREDYFVFRNFFILKKMQKLVSSSKIEKILNVKFNASEDALYHSYLYLKQQLIDGKEENDATGVTGTNTENV